MTTDTHADMTVVATGGFNTGRLYTANGQRIWWSQRGDGWLYFVDRDRMVSGWIDRNPALVVVGRPVRPDWVMLRYDGGQYRFYAPGQTEPNPTPPADFDYGAPLNI